MGGSCPKNEDCFVIPRTAVKWTPQGKRQRDRPLEIWRRNPKEKDVLQLQQQKNPRQFMSMYETNILCIEVKNNLKKSLAAKLL